MLFAQQFLVELRALELRVEELDAGGVPRDERVAPCADVGELGVVDVVFGARGGRGSA